MTSNVLIDRFFGRLGMVPEQKAFVDDVVYRRAVLVELADSDVELFCRIIVLPECC